MKEIRLNGMTFVDVKWYNNVGIVTVQEVVTGGTKHYIGVCKNGNTEEDDIRNIMAWGSRFYPESYATYLHELTPK